MIIEGQFTFAGPRPTVYALLQDPDVLVKTLPGAKSLTRTGPDRFEGVMAVGVGPVTAADFTVAMELHDQAPPERFAVRVEGQGTLGFARGAATIALEEASEGQATVMRYRAELQVGGKIASVGQRLLDSASRMMTKLSLHALARELEARLQ